MALGRMWTESTMHAGRYQAVAGLLNGDAASHFLTISGNAIEGWQAGLCSKALPNMMMPVSPLFHRDYGDRRKDCEAAARRCYALPADYRFTYTA
jgi:hypothetical protein